jgi:hypothetical protein
MCDYRIGYWIYWPFTRIHSRLVSASNYSEIAILHNSQFTTAPAKLFSTCCVFTSLSLATASNSGGSSASRAQVHSSQSNVQNWLGRPKCPPYNPLAQTMQKHPVSKSTSIVARRFIAAGTCLPSRCTETAPIYPTISRPLHSNSSTLYSINTDGRNWIHQPEDGVSTFFPKRCHPHTKLQCMKLHSRRHHHHLHGLGGSPAPASSLEPWRSQIIYL